MPVLMIALLALAAFGVIGGLLAAAAVLETRTTNTHSPVSDPKTARHKSAA